MDEDAMNPFPLASQASAGNPSTRPRKTIPVVVVLDNLRSGLNVGSIFRSADAFCVREIVLCGYTSAPPHPEILKTALGATETVPWRSFSSTKEAVASLREAGYTCVPVEQTPVSINLGEIDLCGYMPIALIFGNEIRGVSADILTESPFTIEIPQGGLKHSLNVATAAGIVLWECHRQHQRRIRSGK